MHPECETGASHIDAFTNPLGNLRKYELNAIFHKTIKRLLSLQTQAKASTKDAANCIANIPNFSLRLKISRYSFLIINSQ